MEQESAELVDAPGAREIFWTCLRMGLRSFGGAAPWARRTLVEEARWMTEDEFTDEFGTTQLLPGPNIVNLCLRLGDRLAGPKGALAAFGGLVCVPMAIAVAIAAFLMQWMQKAAVRSALAGMAAASAGLLLHLGLRMARRSRLRPAPLVILVATLVAAGPARVPLAAVLVVAIPLSFAANRWWR